jgi:hypothetical protein
LETLRTHSRERVASNPEFTYALEDLTRIRELVVKNSVALSEKERLAEIEKDKARSDKRSAERLARPKAPAPKAFRITLDNADGALQPIEYTEPKASAKGDPAAGKKEEKKAPSPEEQAAPSKVVPHQSPALRNDPVKEESLKILSDWVRSPQPKR